MPACRYTLFIRFLSNERPFGTTFDPSPYGPADDAAAVAWARGMAETMGHQYTITLLKDGEAMPTPGPTGDRD